MGVAVPLRLGSQATAHLHSHPATLAGIRRQTPTSGPLPAKTDNTFEKPRRDGGTRTRGLLLPNQLHPDAEHSLVSPGVAFTWDDARCASPDVAQCPCMLAPTLAPKSYRSSSREVQDCISVGRKHTKPRSVVW